MIRTLPLLCVLLIVLVQPAPAPLAGRPAALDNPDYLITRLNTATDSLTVGERRVFGNLLFFNGDDGRSGAELWVSDGTAAGSRRLTDLVPGLGNAYPRAFTPHNGALYFLADAGDPRFAPLRTALFRSDGTPAGTTRITTVTGADPCFVTGLAATPAGLFITGAQTPTGQELLFSDGTAAGTRTVAAFATGTCNQGLAFFTPLGERIFFAAVLPEEQRGLWLSDGTPAGTQRLAAEMPNELAALGDRVAFTTGFAATGAATFYQGFDLRTSDGTATGTRLIRRFAPPVSAELPELRQHGPTPIIINVITNLTAIGSRLLFAVNGIDAESNGLWALEGATLTRLSPLRVGSIVAAGATALVIVSTESNEDHLLSTDGTPAGTTLLLSARGMREAAQVGATIYLRTSEAAAHMLWRRDAAGQWTPVRRLDGIGTLTPFGDDLLLIGVDGAHGAEWWRSDGTPDGTRLIADLNTTGVGSSPHLLTTANNRLFFFTRYADANTFRPTLWLAAGPTGTPTRLIELTPELSVEQTTMAGERLFALVADQSSLEHPRQLLVSDGTAGGTRMFVAPVSIAEITALRDRVVFGHDVSPTELWASDGTPGGTAVLRDLGARIFGIVRLGDQVLAVTIGGGFLDVWTSDGSAAGTTLLKRFAHDETDRSRLVADDTTALMFLDAPGTIELLRSDGSAAGTTLNALPIPTDWIWPRQPGIFGGKALIGSVVNEQFSVWVSDGTAAGTLKLADLPASLELATPLGAGVLFTSGAWGGTLWFSDGTSAGTRQLLTLAHDQRFVNLGRVHNRALFTVEGGFAGELWASDGTRDGTRRVQAFARKTAVPAQALEWAYAAGALFLNPETIDYGSELWALPNNVRLQSSPIVGAEPGATLAIPLVLTVNHAGVAGDLTVEVTLDPLLEPVGAGPAQTSLSVTFTGMGYLDRRAQDVLVRLPANAAYGTSYTVTATLRNAPPNDPPVDNQVRITVRAARQMYLPMQNAE